MAGTHQIWNLDLRTKKCTRYSGSGREGNSNTVAANSSWAQPSGITAGMYNGNLSFFIADSESSAIRAINAENVKASPVVGANANDSDLFDFDDVDGKGYSAKL